MTWHQRVHDQIIDRGRRRDLPSKGPKGFNRHHIVPRSMGGTNEPSNLVDLTHREHFIIHWLLKRIHGGKMATAFWLMCQKNNPTGHRPTSSQYEWARRSHSNRVSERFKGRPCPMKGRKHTSEARANMSKSKKGIPRGPRAPLTSEHKSKLSKSLKGRPSPMKGNRHTEEAKRRMSMSRTGFKHASETIEVMVNRRRDYWLRRTSAYLRLLNEFERVSFVFNVLNTPGVG